MIYRGVGMSRSCIIGLAFGSTLDHGPDIGFSVSASNNAANQSFLDILGVLPSGKTNIAIENDHL